MGTGLDSEESLKSPINGVWNDESACRVQSLNNINIMNCDNIRFVLLQPMCSVTEMNCCRLLPLAPTCRRSSGTD